MSNERLHEYHEHNAKRPVAEICRAAIDEMIAVIGRTTKSQATVRMTVPPQHDDSDTLIIDALYKGIEAGRRAEQAEALLRGVLADSRAGLQYRQEKHKTWGNYHCLYCEAFNTSSNLDHEDGCAIKAARELLAKIETDN